jgi:Mg/Co/Ni transporter MgtE
MANATAIRAALVRKLLEGGHRLRVEHILQKLDERETCALLQALPEREARSVAAILVGPSGGPDESLSRLGDRVAGEALDRLDGAWAASILRRCSEERRAAILASLPSAAVERLRAAMDGRTSARRIRWPWRRKPVEAASAVIGLVVSLGLLGTLLATLV